MLSFKEACAAIGVPYRSALYHFQEGRIPVTRIAGRCLISSEALRRALDDLGYRPRRARAA
jgi:predicted site-specific integrase-resolvase